MLLRLIRDQRVAFLVVGAVNTGIGFLLFVAFSFTVGRAAEDAWGAWAASVVTLVCAHIIATCIAFVLHRTLVFRVRGHVWLDFLRFQAVYLVTFSINLVVLPLLVLLGLDRILAQALITVVTVVISWFGHKYFSFRRGKADEPGDRPDEIERGVL
jgi:putative flippase GtrA